MRSETYTDPGVLQGLLSADPLRRVDGQHLVDEVLGLRGHRVPLWGGELSHTAYKGSDCECDDWRSCRVGPEG